MERSEVEREEFSFDEFMKEDFHSMYDPSYKESDLNEKNRDEFNLIKWAYGQITDVEFDVYDIFDLEDCPTLGNAIKEICDRYELAIVEQIYSKLDDILIGMLDSQGFEVDDEKDSDI